MVEESSSPHFAKCSKSLIGFRNKLAICHCELHGGKRLFIGPVLQNGSLSSSP